MSTGWPAVAAVCAKLGHSFDGWQIGLGQLLLSKRKDGIYAALYNVVSIPRQVGKTYLLALIVFALSVIRPNTLTLWTAHRFKTSRETFDAMRALCEQPLLAAHIDRVTTGAGSEAIHFVNGSRILFGSRERGFGRGFASVDILIFDEAQILGQNALDDMVPAANAAPNALVILAGTPPKPTDPGEAFTTLRREALDGTGDGDVLYVEISADEDAEPNDRDQWAKANPSYPHRTSARSILRMQKLLGIASFMREGLGIWQSQVQLGFFANGAWEDCADDESEPPEPVALAVAADVDQTWLSLAAASDGHTPHLGAVLRMRFDARRKFAKEVARIATERNLNVAIDKRGPAAPLIEDLIELDVNVIGTGLDDLVDASVGIRDAVEARRVSHANYPDLNEAVDNAAWRIVGDRRVIGRKAVDVSMFEAAALALWLAENQPTYDSLSSIL